MTERAPTPPGHNSGIETELLPQQPNKRDEVLADLQESLTREKDTRREERFIFIVLLILLLDVVFFSVLPNFGGPLALLILELLVLLPLAKHMGMEEIGEIISGVIGRIGDGVQKRTKDQ